jgi:hypothetical protein
VTVPTSPVRNHPSSNFSGAGSRQYDVVTHGPRTSISPTASPSHGNGLPLPSMMRSSIPGTTRPVLARQSSSSVLPAGTPAGGCPTAPTGDVSVMPQPWISRNWWRWSKRSINARGNAAPPHTTARKEDRSISWSSP